MTSRGFQILSCVLLVTVVHHRIAAQSPDLRRYEQSWPAMGVQLRIVAYSHSRATAQSAFIAARQRVEQLEAALSNYRSNSEVSKLAAARPDQWYYPSQDLWNLLTISHAISQQTAGAFDVTLAPLTDVWRRARQENRLPDEQIIDSTLAQVGYQRITYDTQQRRIKNPSAKLQLDFGGIGKGFAADEALKILRVMGLGRALVELGGDIAIGDPPPDKTDWRIAIAPLKLGATSNQFIELNNCGVATSGDQHQFLELAGKRYSHIVDPKTGYGVQTQIQVTVIGKSATQADAMASAFSVLLPEESIEICNRLQSVQVYGRQSHGETENVVFRSNNFPRIHQIDNGNQDNNR